MKKRNAVFFVFFLLLIGVGMMSCSTSSKALEKGKYTSAMSLAYKEYTKDSDNQNAKQNLIIAADTLSHRAVANAVLYDHEDINDWRRKRGQLYDGLTMIGDYNIKTNGLVSDSYNQMCDAKYEVDISIVDYYYQYGIELLDESVATGKKELARDAYDEFRSSEREEAREFYHDLDSLYESCITYGSILVKIPKGVKLNDHFLKEWTEEVKDLPDCTVTINKDRVDIDIDRFTEVNTLSKKVVTGTEEILDTAGVVIRTKDIKEEVFAYENIETLTITASANVYVNVEKNNDNCFLKSYTEHLTSEEECENIEYTGDERARKFKHDKSCNEFFIKNDVRRDVESDLNSTIWIY